MNLIQKLILLVGIAAIIRMGIYPPWVCIIPSQGDRAINGGYAVITSPPSFQVLTKTPSYNYGELVYIATIDLRRLGLQWAMVAIATIGLLLVFKSRKKADGKLSSVSA